MIRVLHVVTYMGRGGLETMIMNYYRHIDRSQVQFDFLTHRDFWADYDDEIEALGGKIYRLSRLVPWSQSYRRALDTFFAEHPEYRIVHVHQDCLSSVILKAAQKHGVPVRIAHSHASNQDKNLKYLIKLYYRRQIPRYATELFACSREAGEWMFSGKEYRILNNAIDAKQYVFSPELKSKVRGKLGICPDSFVIGHVGRFEAPKNHSKLIDVFCEICGKQENARLLLIGDGKLRPMICDKVRQLGLEDRVIFTGVRDDVPALMQAMDVFALPSLYEGLGIVAIEAQASGLPCVLSDTVSDAAMVTPLAEKVPLDERASHWAERILRYKEFDRYDTSQQIIGAGFDIVENARWLQNEYLTKWKACD